MTFARDKVVHGFPVVDEDWGAYAVELAKGVYDVKSCIHLLCGVRHLERCAVNQRDACFKLVAVNGVVEQAEMNHREQSVDAAFAFLNLCLGELRDCVFLFLGIGDLLRQVLTGCFKPGNFIVALLYLVTTSKSKLRFASLVPHLLQFFGKFLIGGSLSNLIMSTGNGC